MLRTALAATAALILTASGALGQSDPARAPQPAAEGPSETPLSAHQRLSLGKSQLQQAAVRLQRAKDTAGTGQISQTEIDEARKIATSGLSQVNGALQELQQVRNTDEAQQAIRNARLELQSAQTAIQGIDAETPGPAIQALKDMDSAADEVEQTTQVAAQPR